MVAPILKIVVTRNTICDNLVGFPKSGHILRNNGKCFGTLHTLPKPPPSVDGGKKRGLAVMANHCQLHVME